MYVLRVPMDAKYTLGSPDQNVYTRAIAPQSLDSTYERSLPVHLFKCSWWSNEWGGPSRLQA